MFEFSQQLKFGHDTWSEFKKYINGTYAELSFQYQEQSDYYKIITEPFAGIQQIYDLLKDSGADQIDFETNFKSLTPRKSGSFNIISIQGISGGNPVPISGTITATNPSVSTINTTPPTSGTYISGLVATSNPTYTNGNMSPLSITTGGRLRVDGSAVTQPVSGTITANAGTGVFDVTPASPIATDYLPVRLTNGSSFYDATGGGGSTTEKTFTAIIRPVTLANNKSLLSITNNNGSSVIAKIYKIFVVNSQNTAVSGTVGNFQIKRCTSHSSGTLITPESLDTDDIIDSNITIRSAATIAGESSRIIWSAKYGTDEWSPGNLESDNNDHINQQLFPLWDVSHQLLKPIIVRANQGITVKFATNSTAGSFDVMIVFTQV